MFLNNCYFCVYCNNKKTTGFLETIVFNFCGTWPLKYKTCSRIQLHCCGHWTTREFTVSMCALIKQFWSMSIPFVLNNIQKRLDIWQKRSWAGGFGVHAGGRDILAFCQQPCVTDSFIRKKIDPSPLSPSPPGHAFVPHPHHPSASWDWERGQSEQVFKSGRSSIVQCLIDCARSIFLRHIHVRVGCTHNERTHSGGYHPSVNLWQKIKDDWWVESGCVEALRCVIVIWGQRNHCQRLSARLKTLRKAGRGF